MEELHGATFVFMKGGFCFALYYGGFKGKRMVGS
jgi:hypothetical protein